MLWWFSEFDILEWHNGWNVVTLIGCTERCAGNGLCLFGDGHRRGCRGRMERGTIFRAEKFQSPGGEDTNGIRESNSTGASEYRQVS